MRKVAQSNLRRREGRGGGVRSKVEIGQGKVIGQRKVIGQGKVRSQGKVISSALGHFSYMREHEHSPLV